VCAQDGLDLVRRTVPQPHPDHFRRRASQEAALAKVVVFGDDREAGVSGVTLGVIHPSPGAYRELASALLGSIKLNPSGPAHAGTPRSIPVQRERINAPDSPSAPLRLVLVGQFDP